jgi:arylsulfatase A-like enzyme
VLENAASSSSWTLPSLTSLMTSLSASGHGCTQVQSRLDPSYDTLAEVLRDAGYDTALVGGHLFLNASFGLTQGFTHVDAEILQTDSTRSSPEVADKGIAWIEEKAAVADGVPWMLWLHFFDPHDTYLAHEGISESFGTVEKIDLYDGEIAFTDLHVGRVLDALERAGLEDDTIVVVVADHGEEFFEHGNGGHGYTLYQEVVHVPLIVRAPGWEPGRIEPVVPTVDLMPTLLELAGLEPRTKIEGASFAPLLRAGAEDVRSAVSEVSWHATQDMRSLQLGGFKYIDFAFGGVELDQIFDLARDPYEECNAAELHVHLLQALHEELARRIDRARAGSLDYGTSAAAALSPEEHERLRKLGYIGDE